MVVKAILIYSSETMSIPTTGSCYVIFIKVTPKYIREPCINNYFLYILCELF